MPHSRGTQPSGMGRLDRVALVLGQLPLPTTHTPSMQHPKLAFQVVIWMHALAFLPRAAQEPSTPYPLHCPKTWALNCSTLNIQRSAPSVLDCTPPILQSSLWQLPEPPHLGQVSPSSFPPLPCGSQGSSWQRQLQPQQLGLGWGAVGTGERGLPRTHRDTPSPMQLLPGRGREGGGPSL
jgi:hypothetical protein